MRQDALRVRPYSPCGGFGRSGVVLGEGHAGWPTVIRVGRTTVPRNYSLRAVLVAGACLEPPPITYSAVSVPCAVQAGPLLSPRGPPLEPQKRSCIWFGLPGRRFE